MANAAAATPALVWLDLLVASAPDLAQIHRAWQESHRTGRTPHLIVTHEDAYSEDVIEQFEEDMELDEEDLIEDTKEVQADDLHEEFKIWSTFESETHSLLDVLEPGALAALLQRLLEARPLSQPRPTDDRLRGHRPLALYHSSDAGAICVRICISSVGLLHELRDSLLTDKFTGELTTAILQPDDVQWKDGCESLGPLSVSVDKTHFATQYESGILRLTKLTKHQRDVLATERTSTNLHIKAAAGAGKTFVALHYMLELLQGDSNSCVLFVAKNMALAFFVAKWLVLRTDESRGRRKLLSRLHLLYEPIDDGPREVELVRHTMQTTPIVGGALDQYDLVVVDEAHHIFSNNKMRTVVQRYGGRRRLLLSDLSQGVCRAALFPNMPEVTLTEVVRSSKRIVAGAMRFQLGEDKLETKCHHQSEVPPLRSFLFDAVEDKSSLYEQYATQTALAIQHVVDEFPDLSLHDRLAVVVPDASWRDRVQPLLERQLEQSLPQRRFQMVDASAACAACLLGGRAQSECEWLVLDGIEQVDGLEKLIVVCVGLDAPASDMLEARSMLYRAITRAHMMVLVVNEFLPNGWPSFLTGVKLSENRKFNSAQTIRAAKVDSERTDRAIAEAAARHQRLREQAAAAIKQRGSSAGMADERSLFLIQHVMEAMAHSTPAANAVADALQAWERHQLLSQAPAAICESAGAASITDPAAVKSLQRVATATLRRGGTLEAAVQSAIADRVHARSKLASLLETHEVTVSDPAISRMLNDVSENMSSRALRDALVGFALSDAAAQQHMHLSFVAERLLQQMVVVFTFKRSKLEKENEQLKQRDNSVWKKEYVRVQELLSKKTVH
eukprot:SAG11_NODE_1981_length_3967_cov_4.093330_1_plen_844_part_10